MLAVVEISGAYGFAHILVLVMWLLTDEGLVRSSATYLFQMLKKEQWQNLLYFTSKLYSILN